MMGTLRRRIFAALRENENYIFLLSVAILPAFQKQGISKQFSTPLNAEFKNVAIKDIVSYALTSGGEHFLNVESGDAGGWHRHRERHHGE